MAPLSAYLKVCVVLDLDIMLTYLRVSSLVKITKEILQSKENIGHTEYAVAPAGLLDTVAAAAAPHPGVHTLAPGQVLDRKRMSIFY